MITIVLGKCGALWGEREQVLWGICFAQAVKYIFQSPSSQSAHICLHRSIVLCILHIECRRRGEVNRVVKNLNGCLGDKKPAESPPARPRRIRSNAEFRLQVAV